MNRQSVLEISKSAFEYNINQIKNYIGEKEIIPVIKANAYGTYMNKNIDLIKNFKMVAIAVASEAIEIRKIGYTGKILLLNQPYIEDIKIISNYDITVGVASLDFIELIGSSNQKFNIHLELETGMGRTGIYLKDIDFVLEKLKKYSNISVEGIYTHLSVADTDKEYTDKQIEIFKEGALKIKKEIPNIKYIHYAASNGILKFLNDECNAVRAGIIMYGYPSSDDTFDYMKLKPVAKLKSKISFIKEVEPDMSISYGRTYISKEKMLVATIGLGYADGIRRDLSNNGQVVINGQKANIIGRVCMDSFMVDVTNIKNVKIGDAVYIWDNELITLEDVALKCNTINYEILSTISDRVPRIFVD